jgi:hypothetical protein
MESDERTQHRRRHPSPTQFAPSSAPMRRRIWLFAFSILDSPPYKSAGRDAHQRQQPGPFDQGRSVYAKAARSTWTRMNDRNFLLSGEPPEPVLLMTTACSLALGNLKRAAESTDWPQSATCTGPFPIIRSHLNFSAGSRCGRQTLQDYYIYDRNRCIRKKSDAVVAPRKVRQLEYPLVNGSPSRLPAR